MSKNHKQLKVNYKKIWSTHHGRIPKDEFGNNYHIHHIDGDPTNNDVTNLQALSAKEHAMMHESEWVRWASSGHKFWTKEGKEKRRISGIDSGNANYKNKIGIHDPSIRREIDDLNSKTWRIVSPSRDIDITVLSLNRWCHENNISRSAMNCAYLNNRPHDDYYLLQIGKDESIEAKYTIRTHKNSKNHVLMREDGSFMEVTNLSKWCKDNCIDREGLRSASYRGSFYKGFRLWFAKPTLTGESPFRSKS